jgi:hypothetical protein
MVALHFAKRESPTMIKRQIKANELIRDIHSGLTDAELSERYDVSEAVLQIVFEKFI